eukprot:12091254-Alexandrium_andersonii.AAC.1
MDQDAPQANPGMSEEVRERIQASAKEAARYGFPGIPLEPSAEYGAGKEVCRDVILKFCELTAYLMGGD